MRIQVEAFFTGSKSSPLSFSPTYGALDLKVPNLPADLQQGFRYLFLGELIGLEFQVESFELAPSQDLHATPSLLGALPSDNSPVPQSSSAQPAQVLASGSWVVRLIPELDVFDWEVWQWEADAALARQQFPNKAISACISYPGAPCLIDPPLLVTPPAVTTELQAGTAQQVRLRGYVLLDSGQVNSGQAFLAARWDQDIDTAIPLIISDSLLSSFITERGEGFRFTVFDLCGWWNGLQVEVEYGEIQNVQNRRKVQPIQLLP